MCRYEVGLATTGTRYYSLADGTRKRPAAPQMKRTLAGLSRDVELAASAAAVGVRGSTCYEV